VTFSALLMAIGLVTIEDHKSTENTMSQLASLATGLEVKISKKFNKSYGTIQYKRIAHLIQPIYQPLHDSGELTQVTICNTLSGEHKSIPDDLGGNPCQRLQTQKEPTKQLQKAKVGWIDFESSKRIFYYSIPFRKNPYVLIISKTMPSSLKLWFGLILKDFILIWIILMSVVTLITSQIKNQFMERFKPQLARWFEEGSSKPSNDLLGKNLNQAELVVISNREPYIHNYSDLGQIEMIRPASGLVTALEPILRNLGGLWIAHGSGTADQATTDSEGKIRVPPSNPKYTLKRVLLSKEEEIGYYYGFANEGLWPLCHLAHNRPIFRLSDWEYYRKVNQRFTDAIPTQNLTQKSLILVQDYHFALVPQLIRKRLNASQDSSARVGIFWHIPWPNPETFGICPWGKDLLKGMLGADVIGFHTQFHCNNFLETCNRYLEARIDLEHFSVSMDNHETFVRAFPIGIEPTPVRFLLESEVQELKLRYGIHAEIVAVGVDRLDYTKGLIERIEGIERFLEKNPQYIGRFTFAQMGSPSRTHIPAYRLLVDQFEASVLRVNERFSRGKVKPIIFLHQHYDWEQIQYFYQIGDVCLVTSLHDGMNLVAKEYVWCQKAEKGALILSKFAGASRELTEAFIVNPYSTEELADSISAALSLCPKERKKRMLTMKEKIESHNAFHWAADLIRALQPKEDSFAVQLPMTDLEDKFPLIDAS